MAAVFVFQTPSNMLSMLEHHGGTVKGSGFRSSPSEAGRTSTGGKKGIMPRLNGLGYPLASDQTNQNQRHPWQVDKGFFDCCLSQSAT